MVRIVVELILVLIAVRWGLGALRAKVSSGGAISRAALEKGARWETHTESGGGLTAVVVRRVSPGGVELGRQVVATIPDMTEDWDLRYHTAMAEARSRLAALESQSS